MLAAVAMIFLILTEGTEELVGVDSPVLGLLAAAVITAAFMPIHAGAERLARRLLPGAARSLELPRRERLDWLQTEARMALAGGHVGRKEERMLEASRQRLGLGEEGLASILRAARVRTHEGLPAAAAVDLRRLTHALLIPGALLFALRSLLLAAGHDPAQVPGLGPLTGIGGVLSLAGLVAALLAGRLAAVGGAALVLVGHFAIQPHAHDLGAGMVYLGTGLLVALWTPRAAAAGALAMAGALLRGGGAPGHLLVAAGSLWLAAALIHGARADMHDST